MGNRVELELEIASSHSRLAILPVTDVNIGTTSVIDHLFADGVISDDDNDDLTEK